MSSTQPTTGPTFGPTSSNSSSNSNSSSSSTDPGVVIYCVICTIILLAFTTITLLRYRHKSVPNGVSFIVWISWTMCLLISFLLPLDLRPNIEDSSAMLPLYESLYWICFFLTWVFTPFQQNYVISGGFTPREKFFGALRLSLLFFTVVGIAAVIGFFYLIIATDFSAIQLGAVAQSFANLWGLSFAIMAMGYGLIEIPRMLWHYSNYTKKLDYLYFLVFQHNNEREEAKDRLDEWVYCYTRSKKYFEPLLSLEYNVVENSLPLGYMSQINRGEDMKLPDITDDTQDILDAINSREENKFNKKLLTKMHFHIKRWSLELDINEHCWFNTIIQVLSLEGVLHAKGKSRIGGDNNEDNNNNADNRDRRNRRNKNRNRLESVSNDSPRDSDNGKGGSNDEDENENVNLSISVSPNKGRSSRNSRNNNDDDSDGSSLNLNIPRTGDTQMTIQEIERLPVMQKCYAKFKMYALPYIYKLLSIGLSVLTIIVIWSELASCFDDDLSILALVVHNSTSTNGVIVFGFVMYGYMCICATFALFRIHLTREYHFYPRNLTDSKSLLVNCAFMMRFMFPLGYNFLLLCKARDRSSFISLFHDMSDLPILGDPVNTALPGLLLFFTTATWFNLYGKILKLLKISRFEFGDPNKNEEVAHQIREGESLVRKFKRQLKTDKELRDKFEFELDHFASTSLLHFNKRGTHTLIN